VAAIATERVITYIDGFNLYYGLKDKGWRRYYWLDLRALSRNLLLPGQNLVCVKYFTARIKAGGSKTPQNIRNKLEEKRKRQTIYLEALNTLQNLHIYKGHYLGKTVTCKKCGNTWPTHEEKMTDVNIATELLIDAFNNAFDTALLVSGDSDLAPAVIAVRRQFPGKRIVVAFPPARVSEQLKRTANAYFTIGKAKFRKSMFPDEVGKSDGYILRRPKRWQKNTK
jgi:uncharacterized LabA/DUF88 family protein